MAELTTAEGFHFCFDPAAITAVADRDADTGEPVTTVYGLTAEALRVREGVEAFLGRIGVARRFAKLTRLDDSPVWFNCAAVQVIRATQPNEYPAAANTLILTGALTVAVRETLSQVRTSVNLAGGNL